jgi:sugar/nucleoside kinase (ribokinase family)
MKILIAGELNPDLILSDYQFFPEPGTEVLVKDLEMTLGSSSAICAVGLARLGNPVTFVANVGADPYGDFCVQMLEREGIDISLVRRRTDLKTGLTVSVTSSQDRALITYPGAIASLTAKDVPVAAFEAHRHLHVSAYYLQQGLRAGLGELFAAARAAGLTTSLDPGWDPSGKWGRDVLDAIAVADVFLPNESEIRAITGCPRIEDGLRSLDNGRTLTICKLGREGCVARHRGALVRAPSFQIVAVDTTGAGDSFAAGFLHAWLRKRELLDCLRFASACGALSTRGVGGTGGQPACQEVENFLAAQTGGSR